MPLSKFPFSFPNWQYVFKMLKIHHHPVVPASRRTINSSEKIGCHRAILAPFGGKAMFTGCFGEKSVMKKWVSLNKHSVTHDLLKSRKRGVKIIFLSSPTILKKMNK